MKSEKRHELQKNELANWLGNHVEGASDYFWPVVGGVVVAFAAAVGIAWYMGTQEGKSATAWDKYYQAFAERDREASLKIVVDTYGDTPAALWARQSVADMSLSKGANLQFSDRAEASTQLKTAEENYQEVLKKARDPLLLVRAQYGMARLQETICQPEQALKYYELVAKTEKDSALGKAAQRDAKRMADPKTVEFLAWFAKEKPRRPVPTGHGGIPGMPLNQMPTDLPERPDISLPGGLNIDATKIPSVEPKLDFPVKPGDTPKPEAPKPDEPKGAEPKKTGE